MVRWGKALTAKPNYLGLIPESSVVEDRNSKFSPDFHMHALIIK